MMTIFMRSSFQNNLKLMFNNKNLIYLALYGTKSDLEAM